MTGQAETSRMGESLAIAENQIGERREFGQGVEDNRQLAKGKQAGHVGKVGPQAHGRVRHAALARLRILGPPNPDLPSPVLRRSACVQITVRILPPKA